MKIKLLFPFIFILLPNLVFSSLIQFEKEYTKFKIYNKENDKIINYIYLKPGEKLKFKTIDVDTLTILSRVTIEEKIAYSYQLKTTGTKKDIKKKIKQSNTSQGLHGERISAYNKTIFVPSVKQSNFQIKNTSSSQLLVRITSKELRNDTRKMAYIKYSPQAYEDEIMIFIGGKSYTYYQPRKGSIQLNLNGPVLLKIISRILLPADSTGKNEYYYQIFEKGEMLNQFFETAGISKKASLDPEENYFPTSGDTNILYLEEGPHELSLVCEPGRDVIFRFYINKSSVEIIQE
ncbi:MAG: hypothetical protein ISS80_06980 [Candidatus Cloacimonetes bacterium]|nr:hypothetical protein [Candidatus Cloacimonadota bacterium]MBL7149803.1 hypothetical protein [Candidatus Cloacimonadota bacterium]